MCIAERGDGRLRVSMKMSVYSSTDMAEELCIRHLKWDTFFEKFGEGEKERGEITEIGRAWDFIFTVILHSCSVSKAAISQFDRKSREKAKTD